MFQKLSPGVTTIKPVPTNQGIIYQTKTVSTNSIPEELKDTASSKMKSKKH